MANRYCDCFTKAEVCMVSCSGGWFWFKATVVDVDPKSPRKLMDYYYKDRRIVAAFKEWAAKVGKGDHAGE